MYDLTDYDFWGPSTAIKSSMTWRSALVLAACGSQFLEYRASKLQGKDPTKDFPGFDLARIGRDLRNCLGPDTRGIRSSGSWNEAAIQLAVLTRTRLISFRPDPSTKDRPFFTFHEKGEELFTALDRSEVLPFLLSPNSKPYWRSLLILAVMSSGTRFLLSEPTPRTSRERRPSLEGATSLSLPGIRSALGLLSKGFKAQARIGNSLWTKNIKVDFIESDGGLKLPPQLVFHARDDEALKGLESMDVVVPKPASRVIEKPALENAPIKLGFHLSYEDALLFAGEAKARGVEPSVLLSQLLEPHLDQIRFSLRDAARKRFEEAKAQLEAEHAKRLALLSQEMGVAL